MQFVVTTHAPSVISSVKDSQLIIVDGSDICPISSGFYGKDANSVLREVMGVSEHPKAVKNMFDMFYDLVDGEEFDRAEEVLDALGSLLGESDSELTSCRVQLDLERMDLS